MPGSVHSAGPGRDFFSVCRNCLTCRVACNLVTHSFFDFYQSACLYCFEDCEENRSCNPPLWFYWLCITGSRACCVLSTRAMDMVRSEVLKTLLLEEISERALKNVW